jgi:hypothetical protein
LSGRGEAQEPFQLGISTTAKATAKAAATTAIATAAAATAAAAAAAAAVAADCIEGVGGCCFVGDGGF